MTDTTYDNSTELDPRIAARLKRDAKGLVAAVIQQYDTREVLMVGYKRQCHTQWIFQFLILKINKVSEFQNNASYFFPGMYLLHFSNSGF